MGLDDDFYQLGGDSLLAVELIVEINRALSAHLDVLTMLQKPTVRALAGHVDLQEAEGVTAKLVRVRPGVDGVPIFFLNTTLQPYGPISRMRGLEPIFATTVPWPTKEIRASMAGNLEELPDLPKIAARHTELILKHGLNGPCFLAGYSYGAPLAFEVAHQLVAAGIRVQAVFLFDGNIEIHGWRLTKFRCRRQARLLREGGLRRCAFLLGEVWRRVRGHPASTEAHPDAPPISSSAEYISGENLPWWVLDRIWSRAVRQYRSRPLPSQGVLFRAQECIYEDVLDYDGKLGWDGLFAGGLDVFEVPGNHSAMWEEPRILIENWESALEKTRPAKASGNPGSHGDGRRDGLREFARPKTVFGPAE